MHFHPYTIIKYLYRLSFKGPHGGWGKSQTAPGERRGSLMTGRQSVTEPRLGGERQFTLTFTLNPLRHLTLDVLLNYPEGLYVRNCRNASHVGDAQEDVNLLKQWDSRAFEDKGQHWCWWAVNKHIWSSCRMNVLCPVSCCSTQKRSL